MKKIIILAVSLLSLLFSSCYSWYDSKIEMDKKTQKVNLNDLFYKEKEITSLEAPKQIIVSQGQYSGSIKLHWNEVPYATSYRLERAVSKPDPDTGLYTIPEEGDFEVLSRYVYSCNYSDIILANPADANKEYSNRYYYRVSAENIKQGLESSEFTTIGSKSCGWLLSPPSYIEAAKGENPEYIQVSWSRVPLAHKYLVYRGEKANGLGMELLDTVQGNRLFYHNHLSENEKGTEFYYKVCAVLADGSQSAFTGLALGYSSKPGAPSAPKDIRVTNGRGLSTDKLEITWNGSDVAAVGAHGETYTITWSVYRTSSADSIYTLVRNNIPKDVNTFTDESLLKPGLKYYYYLQSVAVNDSDSTDVLKSPFSKTGPGSQNEAVGWLLSPPNSCEVADSPLAGKVIVRWSPAVGSEITDYIYNIYSSQSLDGEYSRLVQVTELSPGDDGFYSITLDKKPFYKIATVNEVSSSESQMSQAIAPCPAAPLNVTASKTSSLGGLASFEANTNGVYPVKITWSAPQGENPSGYHVYRSTKADSSFRKITEQPVTGNLLEFIDKNETARAGTFYYYKVVSLNLLGQGKNSNSQTQDSRGYGALTRDQWFREYNKTAKHSQTKLTLMHKSNDMDKLGSESINGAISGTLSYNAKIDGLGARILMHYTNYADFYAADNSSFGLYFLIDGDTNTSANMSANGNMDGTVTASNQGMYPGYAKYDKLQIKGGGAGGGYYIVSTRDKNGNTVLGEGNVDWTVGEE